MGTLKRFPGPGVRGAEDKEKGKGRDRSGDAFIVPVAHGHGAGYTPSIGLRRFLASESPAQGARSGGGC